MITLKASRFIVEYDEKSNNGYNVFVRRSGENKNITDTLSDDEKEELIGDLIYCIDDLVKKVGAE